MAAAGSAMQAMQHIWQHGNWRQPLPAQAVPRPRPVTCQTASASYHSQARQDRHPDRPAVGARSEDAGNEDVSPDAARVPVPLASRRGILTGTLTATTLAGLGWPAAEASRAATGAAAEAAVEPITAPATAPLQPGPAAPPACTDLTGISALRDPYLNKGLATADEARAQLQLQGLLPPGRTDLDTELLRARAALARAPTPLDKYQVLMTVKEQNAQCFYTLLQEDVQGLLPLVYTPAVGDACLAWGSLMPRPTGLYVSYYRHKGRVQAVVNTWPAAQVRIAVITDGERILGLGDLGAHGMGIPVGKSVVYGACGVDARWVLPVCVDVGCNTAAVRDDPLYVGTRLPRIPDTEYYPFMQEVVDAIQRRYGGGVLVHWEDVGSQHSFQLLAQLQGQGVPTFNDDIQATAAVTLAALLGATRLPGVLPLRDQVFLFFGAGQASLGIAQLVAAALEGEGLTPQQARRRIWLMDRRGLLLTTRADLGTDKLAFAQHPGQLPGDVPNGLLEVIQAVQPTTLIGAASVRNAFTQQVVEALVVATDARAAQLQQPGGKADPQLLAQQQPGQLRVAWRPAADAAADTAPPAVLTPPPLAAAPRTATVQSGSTVLALQSPPAAFATASMPAPTTPETVLMRAVAMPVPGHMDVSATQPQADGTSTPQPPPSARTSSTRSISSSSTSSTSSTWSISSSSVGAARPVLLALSNPTSRAECSFADAYAWSGGRVVYASGTQFPGLQVDPTTRQPVTTRVDSRPTITLSPAQCNNCYVFPGIGLGAIAMGPRAARVSQGMLLAAAAAVAEAVSQQELLASENVLPPLNRLGEVTLQVAAAVAAASLSEEAPLLVGSSSGGRAPAREGSAASITMGLKCQATFAGQMEDPVGAGSGSLLRDALRLCIQQLVYNARQAD